MPKILVINPNTSPEMTADIKNTVTQIFNKPWQVIVKSAPAGPESLESWTDYHLASVCVLPLLEQYSDVDGIVLACFGDPGLYVLKESAPIPVVGIAEASMSIALMLGQKFGILAGMRRAVELMNSMVRTYGLESRYAGTVSLDMRVLDFEKKPEQTLKTLVTKSIELREKGAEVLLLGCAGLTGFTKELQQEVSMPVIDPVVAGCSMLKSIVEMGLQTSHAGLFCKPAEQRMNHLERLFSPEMENILKSKR
jgi:allantoin racemase